MTTPEENENIHQPISTVKVLSSLPVSDVTDEQKSQCQAIVKLLHKHL